MDVVVELLWLAAIIAVIGSGALGLWRNRARVARFLLCVALAIAAFLLLGDELGKMMLWYFGHAVIMLVALPALLILDRLVFQRRLKRLWTRYTAWCKRAGTAIASLVTLAILFAFYLICNGGVWLLPILILGFIFRNQIGSAWVAARAAVRFP